MKRFCFSLERVRRLRAFRVRELEVELSKVLAEYGSIDTQIRSIAGEYRARMQDVAPKRGAVFSAASVSAVQDQIDVLQLRREQLLHKQAHLSFTLEQLRERYAHARRAHEALLMLEEKEKTRWREQRLRAEDRACEDLVSARVPGAPSKH